MNLFSDQFEAGKFLSKKLTSYSDWAEVIVFTLPEGGVPVAYEIAKELNIQLQVLLVRKLGLPGNEKLTMGAIASGGVSILDQDIIHASHLSDVTVESIISREQEELRRQESLYYPKHSPPHLLGRIILLVDDGSAPAVSLRAAIYSLRSQKPAQIVLAVPIVSMAFLQAFDQFAGEVDELIYGVASGSHSEANQWYKNFIRLADEEVIELLERVLLIKQSSSEQQGF